MGGKDIQYSTSPTKCNTQVGPACRAGLLCSKPKSHSASGINDTSRSASGTYRGVYQRRCLWTFQLVMSVPGRAWAISENQLR